MTENKARPGAAFVCDTQGRILRMIRDDLALGDLLPTGRLFPSLVARDQLPEAMDFLMDVQQQNAVFSHPFSIVTEERDVRLLLSAVRRQDDILLTAIPVTVGDSAPDAVFTLDEFTRLNNELANLQRSLTKRNVELNRLNELKNEFLGMAAHDLRGSLWAIGLSCQVLLREVSSDLDPEMQDYLRTIAATSESLQKIVSAYLDISTIESGKLELRSRPANLRSLLERSIQLNKVLADAKNITIRMREEAPCPIILVDGEKILQVVNNLIGNAVKFSPPGSEILVRISPSTSREVVFTVEDQGQGIEASDLQHIFEPFGRAVNTSKPREKGSGLGLAIAKKIVDAHGGRISVESRSGQGSVFSVSLPMEPPTPP